MKSKNKPKKVGESIVSRTQKSLSALDRREKSITLRIEKLQKRLDAVSKLGLEMDNLKAKAKEIASLKEARLAEIKSLAEAFGSPTPAENPQTS